MGDFALPDLRDRIVVHQSSGYNPAVVGRSEQFGLSGWRR